MNATITKNKKPKTKMNDYQKLITMLKKKPQFTFTYLYLCKVFKCKSNYVRAMVDTARDYAPIINIETVGYKIAYTQAEKAAYREHLNNSIRHIRKHIEVI